MPEVDQLNYGAGICPWRITSVAWRSGGRLDRLVWLHGPQGLICARCLRTYHDRTYWAFARSHVAATIATNCHRSVRSTGRLHPAPRCPFRLYAGHGKMPRPAWPDGHIPPLDRRSHAGSMPEVWQATISAPCDGWSHPNLDRKIQLFQWFTGNFRIIPNPSRHPEKPSGNMLEGCAVANALDGPAVHPKEARRLTVVQRRGPELTHAFWGNGTAASVFVAHVGQIVGHGAHEQVLRIATWRIVASVQYTQAGRHGAAIGEFPSQPVGACSLIIDAHAAITAAPAAAMPDMAASHRIDLRQFA